MQTYFLDDKKIRAETGTQIESILLDDKCTFLKWNGT